jgi:hypothetical protein
MAKNPERRRPDLRRGYGEESGEEEARISGEAMAENPERRRRGGLGGAPAA